jgi:hypothetical protein
LLPVENTTPPDQLPPNIATVPTKFVDVFSEPTKLPPSRDCDHSIPLQEKSTPPNIRPYRIPHKKKDEVEKLIRTML